MKSHRGLSAVVGTVFLVAIVIGALTYVSYSLEIMGNFSEQLIAEESRQRDIQDEKFSLTFVDVTPSDKLDATIKNTGDIPVKITTLYLDEMGANDVVQKHSIDKTISPGTSFNFLTEGIDVDVDSTKGYSMKLVSSRGETQTFYLNSASQESVDIQLIALPDIVPTGFSTTLMMVVVNNMSNNNPLVNLTPVEPTCIGICSKLSGPVPASYDMLAPGDVAIFEWVFELNGDEDDSVTFTGQLQNGFPGNTDSETVTIKSVELADVAGQSITSLGFGQQTLDGNLLVLHTETFGVPVAAVSSALPEPIRNFELNGDATDELGGTDLQLSDGGTGLTSTGWNFLEADKAQIVAGEVPELEYAIEMVFAFDDTSNWARVLDYHNSLGSWDNQDSEYGLYVETGNFHFWALSKTGGTMSNSVLTHVLIQRTSSGIFEMYQNGVLISSISFDDNEGQLGDEEAIFRGTSSSSTGAQPATFFYDGPGEPENSDGFVDCIRVFDQALSSEDAIALTSDSNTCYTFPQVGHSYQMSSTIPDTSGTTIILNDVNDKSQWFSANVTTYETTISAGVWNASLRYNNDRLPSGMAAGASDIHDNAIDGGGHTLHFNTSPTLARKDSGQMSSCTSLVDSGTLSGATWDATGGVNGSGAYYFDGNDYITITHSGVKQSCNYPDEQFFSVAGWFNGTKNSSFHDRQTIFSKWDASGGEQGGIRIEVGDDGEDDHGRIFFRMKDDNGDNTVCESDEPDGNGGDNYLDSKWHHFVAVEYDDGKCRLYVDGVLKDDDDENADAHDHYDEHADVYIGTRHTGAKGFTGYIDDIMFWNNYVLTADDVTALYQHSFGENSTRLNFFLNNATDVGDTVDVLAADLSYGLPWVDQMDHTDKDDLWAGGNWTFALPQVNLHLDPANRLNFTISYASGAPLNLRVDDDDLDGTSSNLISSYIQVPGVDPELPAFRVHDRDNKVTFFAYNGEEEGVWLTYQGTRIVFNGTNGHYTGVVDTVSNGVDEVTLNVGTDSPFIDEDVEASVVFWHPQVIPTASQPGEPEKIPEGNYNVFVYLNGYDEDGTAVFRNIDLGTVRVIE